VGIKQHGMAMRRLDARKFFAQGGVVRLPVNRSALRDIGRRWQAALAVQGITAEKPGGA
jgi:hypothetical protein